MKRLWIPPLVITLVLVTVGAVPDQDAPALPAIKIALDLSVTKAKFVIGDSVAVVVTLRNIGREPCIVSNTMNTSLNNHQGHVSFELTNGSGHHETAKMQWVADNFAPPPEKPDWQLLLGSWMVLYPRDSISRELALDQETFTFLGKPGDYAVTATYSSAGFSFPENYKKLGLAERDVASVKLKTWAGTVTSNPARITLVEAKNRQKP